MKILHGLGDAQQLIGAQLVLNGRNGAQATRRKKRAATKAAARPKKKRAARAVAGKRKPLKKGSAEAKAFMARLRKMRRK